MYRLEFITAQPDLRHVAAEVADLLGDLDMTIVEITETSVVLIAQPTVVGVLMDSVNYKRLIIEPIATQ